MKQTPRMSASELAAAIARVPRVRLAALPTPLDPAPRLGAELGITLHVKRDDLTGLALGGNKSRQLEFILGAALQAGATAIVSGAGIDSNHCRQLAAACAKLGLTACFVLRGDRPSRLEGNLLLDTLFGAEYRFVPTDRFYGEFPRIASEWAGELSARGLRPYLVDTLGWDSPALGLAALGYVDGALELEAQFESAGWRPDAIYLCSGAATQAGLVLAKKLLGREHRIVGISASPFIPDKPSVIAQVATRAARQLGQAVTVDPSEVEQSDAYIGPGYGVLTPEGRSALQLAARLEGLLLDPTYTAKAMAALVDHARRGIIGRGANVLFLHTGGAPALFLERNESITA